MRSGHSKREKGRSHRHTVEKHTVQEDQAHAFAVQSTAKVLISPFSMPSGTCLSAPAQIVLKFHFQNVGCFAPLSPSKRHAHAVRSHLALLGGGAEDAETSSGARRRSN